MKGVAIEYFGYGLATLPVKADKSPDCLQWKEGVDDLDSYNKSHGIGIICGELSGKIEVLDFDNHFGNAKEIISEFMNITDIKDLNKKHQFVIENTQSGGYHLIYKSEKIEGNQKLAMYPKWSEKWNKFIPDAVIETRGEGGYIVAAPTNGYQVIRGSIDKIPTITSEERDLLIENAKSFNKWVEYKDNKHEAGDKPGDIYNEKLEAIDEMKGALSRAGWKEIRKNIWQRPDKSKGISATLGKVAPNVFYCFTANGYPFEPEKGYKPFQVVGLLDYQGDFNKLAKELAERYDLGNKPDYARPVKKEEKQVKEIDYEDVLQKSYIDLAIPPEKPPIIMEISNFVNGENVWQRLLTLGNFSVITGKAKSKKTFSTTMPMASFVKNGIVYNKFRSILPSGKRTILKIDTEQATYDAYIAAKRIERLVGFESPNFGTFDLREYMPYDRMEIIEYIIKKFSDVIGVILIDGIADCVNDINNIDEAVSVVTAIMKWTKVYNCHIICIIHQNKNDNYATGHLGSYLIKKAECVISVEKDTQFSEKSLVTCSDIRGTRDFEPFAFQINETGMPELCDYISDVKPNKIDWEPVKNYYEKENESEETPF